MSLDASNEAAVERQRNAFRLAVTAPYARQRTRRINGRHGLAALLLLISVIASLLLAIH